MGFEELLGVNPWTALFILLNTLIIFFVAKKFLIKPIMNMIRERQKEIDDTYADAENARNQAKALQNEYEQKLSDAAKTGEQMVKDAVARGQAREDEILQKAREDAEAIRRKAAEDAEREKKKAFSEAKDSLSEIAVSIAEKVVERNLEPADQSRLLDQFIQELGEQK